MARVAMMALALGLAATAARAQAPDSTKSAGAAETEDPDVQALRQQFRQRWHEHIRQTLGLRDDQAARVQETEDRFEQQRVQARGQLRDIDRQLNAETLSGKPDNDHVNQLLQRRQDTHMRLEQLNRDEDREMAGYLSPLQRVRYQRERQRVQTLIAETIRHRRARARADRGGSGPGGRRGRRLPR